jgi:hypothetical protein
MTSGDLDFEAASRDLYGAAPEEFLAHRSEWVARARAGGSRELATAIGKLRRPTATAWLVNLLTRDPEGAEALRELAALGARTRTAQAALDAEALRELDRRRRELVRALVDRADEVGGGAGHPVTAAVERELTETFAAAVVTAEAAAAVTSGTLTRALAYSGFGDVDLAAAAAVPRPAAQALAAEALAAAEAEFAAVRQAADDASRRSSAARARRDTAAAHVDAMDARLASARDSLAAAESELAAAAAEHARLESARWAAQSALAARRRLADLSG